MKNGRVQNFCRKMSFWSKSIRNFSYRISSKTKSDFSQPYVKLKLFPSCVYDIYLYLESDYVFNSIYASEFNLKEVTLSFCFVSPQLGEIWLLWRIHWFYISITFENTILISYSYSVWGMICSQWLIMRMKFSSQVKSIVFYEIVVS